MGHRLALTADLDEARRMLQASQEQIVACAEEAIQQQGYSYSVALVWDVREFPTRAYGNVTLPAGEYESVRILIGEAEGANWWCVMFPPLCFIAEDTATTEDTATAERYIYQTAEGYQLHRGISVAPKDIGCAEDTASAEDTTSREQASEQGQGGTKRNAADSVDFSRYDEAQGGSLLTDGSGPVQKRFFFMDFVKSLFGG
jgi:hypothetical protein